MEVMERRFPAVEMAEAYPTLREFLEFKKEFQEETARRKTADEWRDRYETLKRWFWTIMAAALGIIVALLGIIVALLISG